jgi:hypothetical protein
VDATHREVVNWDLILGIRYVPPHTANEDMLKPSFLDPHQVSLSKQFRYLFSDSSILWAYFIRYTDLPNNYRTRTGSNEHSALEKQIFLLINGLGIS